MVCDGGAVGRAVASNTRDLWFDSQHRQEFYKLHCIGEKIKKNKKEAGKGPFLKREMAGKGSVLKSTDYWILACCSLYLKLAKIHSLERKA